MQAAGYRREIVFRDEVRDVVSLIQDGVSVHVGEIAGGGSEVFGVVGEALKKQSHHVLQIRCSQTIDSASLAALRFSGVWSELALGDSASMFSVVQNLTDFISSRARVVLAIENVEYADPVTWAVLAAVCERTGVTVFSVGQRVSRARRAGLRSPSDIVWPWQEVLLESLSFYELGSLAANLLQGPPTQEVVRSVYAETQGYYLFANAVIESCRRNEALVRRDGVWHLNGPLWNPELEGYVDSFMAGKTPEVREAMDALAVMGGMEVEAFCRRYSSAVVQRLEEDRLVLAHVDGEKRVLEVSPPIVRRYLSGAISDIRRQEIISRFSEDQEFPAQVSGGVLKSEMSGEGENWPESHPVLRRPRIEDVAFAESMRMKWRARYDRERALWKETPSLETGLPFLRTITIWEGRQGEIDEQLTVLSSLGGTSAAAAEVGAFALERLFLLQQKDRASEFALELADRFPHYGHSFEAQALLLATCFSSAEEVRQQFAALPKNQDELTGIVNRFREVVGGESVGGLDMLFPAASELQNGAFVRQSERARYLIHGLQLIAGGKVVESAGWALDRLGEALESEDYRLIVQNSYVSSLGLYMMGRIDDVLLVSDAVFASEPPESLQRYYYAALLQLNAVIAYRRRQSLVALRFIDHFDAMLIQENALPGLTKELGGAIRLLVEEDLEGASGLIASGITRCIERGWVLAAFHLAVVATDLGLASSLHERACWQELRGRVSPSLRLLLDLGLSIEKADAENTSALGDQFLLLGEKYFAAVSYESSIRFRLRQGNLGSVVAVEKLRDAAELPPSHYSFESSLLGREGDSVLSSREEEIAAQATRSTQEIARLFSLSPRTVENHLHRAMKKLHVADRRELENAVMTIRGHRKGRR